MQHRTNEAMNGLFYRLDKIIEQAGESGKLKGRQQWVMIGLTVVLALSTVAYTAVTVWSTAKTTAAQEVVRGFGAVPESAAVRQRWQAIFFGAVA